MLDISQEIMEANPCYHDAQHLIRFSYIFQIKIRPVTSSYIVIPILALFGFVLLYYYFCGVCFDMLTCLFCILIGGFATIKLQKMQLIRIIKILLSLTNNNLNHHQTHHAPSGWYIRFLSSFSSFHFSPPSLNSLH